MSARGCRGRGSLGRASTYYTVWCPTDTGEHWKLATVTGRTAARMISSGTATWDEHAGVRTGLVLADVISAIELAEHPEFRPRLVHCGGEPGIPDVWEIGYAPTWAAARETVERALHDAMPGAISWSASSATTPAPAYGAPGTTHTTVSEDAGGDQEAQRQKRKLRLDALRAAIKVEAPNTSADDVRRLLGLLSNDAADDRVSLTRVREYVGALGGEASARVLGGSGQI